MEIKDTTLEDVFVHHLCKAAKEKKKTETLIALIIIHAGEINAMSTERLTSFGKAILPTHTDPLVAMKPLLKAAKVIEDFNFVILPWN